MKISEILKNNKVTVSFEVFPPKQWDKLENTKNTVKEMCKYNPSFMSVTYGAAGTTSGFTTEIANEIKKCGVSPLSHLTCLTSTRDKIHQVVGELEENGIENILALRGDIPQGFEFTDKQYFKNAYQLVNEIKSINPNICVGGACYPEIHPESKNRVEDIARLKEKVDCGVEFLTTQMFFDNEKFFNFYEMCQIKGINVPIIAGIMPITNANQVSKMVDLSNAYIPRKLLSFCDRFRHDSEAMKQAGIAYATDQIIDLISNGIRGIHIYTMNKPEIAESIVKNVDSIIKAVNK